MPPMPPKCGDLTELVMERRGPAMVVTHNAMPADSTVASTLRHRGAGSGGSVNEAAFMAAFRYAATIT